ncbi:MAG: hypothetical protein CMF49_02955 [Legionellales bacterium]|nr:hypothetical protein [Legionellales bacterium]|tara:strand:- start:672 stop:989 length:318 start_codon:yes stop_codon:yes gene_type:complete
MAKWYPVATIDEIPAGEYKAVFAGDEDILLIHCDDQFYAIQDRCSHQEAPLDGGDLEGDQFFCPLHGASFCIKTGEATAPPAYEPINTYPTKIDHRTIFVEIEED